MSGIKNNNHLTVGVATSVLSLCLTATAISDARAQSAEPKSEPLLPQRYAEIMGGRIPRSRSESDIPRSLDQTLIGPLTAHEINWSK